MAAYICVIVGILAYFAGAGLAEIPIVLNTWNFRTATDAGWAELLSDGSPIDAVVAGCTQCEEDRCDGSVGWGGSPDENGETTLDAMVMEGSTFDMGAVAGLRRVRNAVGVAREVLLRSHHSMLVGDHATDFAIQMGFPEENLTSSESNNRWESWKENDCQPNYWKNVMPDPTSGCGPYTPNVTSSLVKLSRKENGLSELINQHNHDTIGMIAIAENRDIAIGTSTNGLSHKIPGRVGDTAIVGAGGYADNRVGAAVATGDGDILIRFLPSLKAVEYIRRGLTATEAAQAAIDEILAVYPSTQGGLVVATAQGDYGAACSFVNPFTYSVRTASMNETQVFSIQC